jgi:hypothetical protein
LYRCRRSGTYAGPLTGVLCFTTVFAMDPMLAVAALFFYAPLALLVCAPACAALARRRNRDAETWLLLGAVGGPLALLWIAALPERPRPNQADALLARRRPTPAQRIPTGRAMAPGRCLLCDGLLGEGHRCSPEAVEDRIQRRWTVRVGGQRIIGPP